MDVSKILEIRLPFGCRPRPFQIDGVRFAQWANYRCLIGDQMGLGKSIQALCCVATDPKKLLPAVVVCPSSMFYTWREELTKWLPTVPVRLLDKSSSTLPARFRGVVITTWGLLPAHSEALARFGVRLLIADECHYALHSDAQRSRAFAHLGKRMPHLILLSGTPLKNRTSELWHLLHVLDAKSWPSFEAFRQEYGRPEDAPALKAVLGRYMIRRLKADVLEDLPAKQRIVVPVELPSALRSEYEEAEADFKTWLRTQGRRPSPQAALARMAALKSLVGRAKVAPAVEQLEAFSRQGEPVIAFVEHLDVLHALEEGLRKYDVKTAIIEGETSKRERQNVIQAFQRGEIDVVIGTQAAKEGITLTRASNVVFVERWWTPADEEQAEDRAHRIGQRNAVSVWYLNVVDTIDDRIRALVDKKRAISDAAIGGTAIQETEADVFEDFLRTFDDPIARLDDGVATSTIGEQKEKGPTLPDVRRVQGLLFDRRLWTAKNAAHWARMHHFPVLSVDATDRYHRVRVHDTSMFRTGTFKHKKLTDTVSVILGQRR